VSIGRKYQGLVLAGLILLVTCVTACSQPPRSGPATVRGLADGCQNPLAKKLAPITVVARSDGRVVKRVTARFRHFRLRYRLVLQPGQYTVSDPMSGAPSHAVTLTAGSVVTINFPNDC
jgi:hypothetical protein